MAAKFLTDEWASDVSAILNSHPGFKTAIASADLGIVYNCRDALTGGGTIPGRWSVKGGSYREVSGS